MAWIISGHLFFYGPSAIENLHMIFTYAESWYLQPLFAVAIAVDTYFVIRYEITDQPILIWNFPANLWIMIMSHCLIFSFYRFKWSGIGLSVFPNREEEEEGECHRQILQLRHKSLSSVSDARCPVFGPTIPRINSQKIYFCHSFALQIDTTVFSGDRINGFRVAASARYLTVLDGWTQWRQLPKLLVAKFILHSEYVSDRGYVYELELVFGRRFPVLLFDVIFARNLYDVRMGRVWRPCVWARVVSPHHLNSNSISIHWRRTTKEKKKKQNKTK